MTETSKWKIILRNGDNGRYSRVIGIPTEWRGQVKIMNNISRMLTDYRAMKEMIKHMTQSQRDMLKVCITKDVPKTSQSRLEDRRYFASLINREGSLPGSFKCGLTFLYMVFNYFHRFPRLFDHLCGTSDPFTGESHASNAPPQSAAVETSLAHSKYFPRRRDAQLAGFQIWKL
ncbi:hypothetical protein T439DRAFT_131306 [Meredithblackwellia eburnea MCA 4105]